MMNGLQYIGQVALLGLLMDLLPLGIQEAQGDPLCIPPLMPVPPGIARLGSPEDIPSNPTRMVEFQGFLMSRHEVTVEEFTAFLNAARIERFESCPHILYRNGRYEVRWGQGQKPVCGVSYTTAQAYCAWLSNKLGAPVRLPTESEWEYAARGGITGARFPWGWGGPEGRACFDQKSACPVEQYAPNAFGLYDMAGNLFEWCMAESEDAPAPARGGSWAERDPRFLRVHQRVHFPRTYQDADVGFRVLMETPSKGKE